MFSDVPSSLNKSMFILFSAMSASGLTCEKLACDKGFQF